MNASDPLPAVVESDATGEIKIFSMTCKRDRRRCGKSCLAPSCHNSKRTAVSLGSFTSFIRKRLYQSSSGRISKQLVLPKLPKFKDEILPASGIDKLGKITINNTLVSYNRTNTVNLIALRPH